MRLTYKDLETKSYRQLIKEGYTQEQLLAKTSDYYLKENKQLVVKGAKYIDGKLVLTSDTARNLSRAIKDLKRGVLKQSTVIQQPVRSINKGNIKNLKSLAKIYGKGSYAEYLLRTYQLGASHHNSLITSTASYTNNQAAYEEKATKTKDVVILTEEAQRLLEEFHNVYPKK